MKLIPIRIEGPHVTCGAFLDTGEFFTETFTHTPDGFTAEEPDKKAIMGYADEFAMLAAEKEVATVVRPKDEYVAGEKYVDAVSGKDLSVAQAEAAFEAATPVDDQSAEPAEPVEPKKGDKKK